MSFDHFYQSELSALRQLGRRFAERSPALAPWLGQPGSDPDVERLLEGFAFLTGRLRHKLDDELPELTHSLIHLLWPNYMRPLPAFSIVQFEALAQAGPGQLVARDTELESREVEGVRCRFRTCYATRLHALQTSGLEFSVKGEGALLSLHLSMTADGHLGQLQLANLRLHLAGERYISQMLYLSLLRHLDELCLVPLDLHGKPACDVNGSPLSFKLSADCVQPVGFAEDQALIPYPLNTFRGYRFLQEYFAFEDKFLFVDINGLDVLGSLPEQTLKNLRGLELRMDIRSKAIEHLRPTLDNIKLYCTPIVNLFCQDALPIRFDQRQDEYLLLPGSRGSATCGVYSVDSVTGWNSGGLDYRTYVPFESFEHDPSFDVAQGRPHYSLRQRPSALHEGLETWLSFAVAGRGGDETVSVQLTCTNQNLPRQLKVGEIDQPCENSPGFIRFRNIVPATASHAPPLSRGFLWKLISNMSLNYLSLANVEALKVILQTYDWPRYHDPHAEKVSRRRLDGLQAVRHEAVDRMHGALPLRGLRTELSIDARHYIADGDLYLFGSVLNEFFALYASLNSFHELQVSTTQGDVYQWTPRMGQQPLL
ncbi:type VI secretion system baseplate subunit TssF [Pseudomonas sp. 21LCFQ02]|uniref:type VI secretion system baseplate subunit TssF n=1 Tax=unclassified Pseudomonas TaxID=196821 RepID=UPI0004F7641B|nr:MULTISPECIES: type VI secretion system baseplate subunit TssF [unclassified Pseudomonas]MCO8170771.1 type VI secretion system baseplate subunit TssF [Pseudomonas sp. 21LCFQ02]MCQ9422387.1 type VI secretion system baseplate subunit TssF [Pseudomonas sp. LJDD11]BAP45745.1 type VI secretion protein TssF2 [Pseudomonas sp. StFLB209]